jgi:hypothetical protein
MGWILFLIGLWLIPFILCIVINYFCWREERDNKTVENFVNYLFEIAETCNYWPLFTPFVNILLLVVLFGRYLYLVFKDTELW